MELSKLLMIIGKKTRTFDDYKYKDKIITFNTNCKTENV